MAESLLRKLTRLSGLLLVAFFFVGVTLGSSTVQSFEAWQAGSTLTVDPPSVVIKVGQSTRMNVTLVGSSLSLDMVCFTVDGFPTSGFVTTLEPRCWNIQPGRSTTSILIVEATPAAAPQSFTAFVVATGANWTTRTSISITVEPAMPAWIPWSIILAFLLLLVSPILIKTQRAKPRRRTNHKKRKLTFRGIHQRTYQIVCSK